MNWAAIAPPGGRPDSLHRTLSDIARDEYACSVTAAVGIQQSMNRFATAAALVLACSNSLSPGAPLVAGEVVGIRPMTVARAAHTATLLRDGRVLLVGGLEAGRTAELFDPQTRTFARTGDLRVPRVAHTATLLPDGRVLIAGGYSGAFLASTEVYDPRRGTFSPGPQMTEARIDHLAVTLADGKTLIVGGQGSESVFLASAEVFDPTTFRFTGTGSMTVPRASHVSALLADSTVLIAGGHSGRRQDIRLYASAERYDPRAGSFIPSGDMSRPRHKHSAVVLSTGEVLVTGGADERDDQGQYRDAELFDRAAGRFRVVGEMRRTRYKHQGAMAVLSDGTVLIAGGAGDAELFDPRSGSFTLIPTSPKFAGSFSTVTQLSDGSVLITGGYGNGTGPRAAAWMYSR